MWSPQETEGTRLLMKLMIWIGILSVPTGMIFGLGHLLLTPCFPGFLGYYLLAPCQNLAAEWRIFPDRIFQVLVVLGMLWTLLPIFCHSVMEVIIYSSLHCFCLTNYLHLFWRKCQWQWNVSRTVRIYKELELLAIYYNRIHGGVLSVTATILLSNNLILSVYALVGLYSEINLSQISFFFLFSFDSFIVLLVCDGGFKATVNTVSERVLAMVRASPYFIKRRIVKRYIKSWPSIKIRLGSTNFYDRETPLNLIAFCVSQVVNLLLL